MELGVFETSCLVKQDFYSDPVFNGKKLRDVFLPP